MVPPVLRVSGTLFLEKSGVLEEVWLSSRFSIFACVRRSGVCLGLEVPQLWSTDLFLSNDLFSISRIACQKVAGGQTGE